jgi:hypothetical protein
MTLVAWWIWDNDLWCAADTRISREDESTVSDTGAKIFLIPVSYGIDQEKLEHFTLGFSFAGATLPAQNTHAIASTLCQMLRAEHAGVVPSAKTVATVYAKVAEHVLRDINSRLPLDRAQRFEGIVFGFCPIEARLKAFELFPKIGPHSFTVDIIECSPVSGNVRGIGSGAQEFDRQLDLKNNIGENRRVLDAFMSVISGDAVRSVGGYPQIAIARQSGVELAMLLSQDDENPDLAAPMVNGFNTKLIGGLEGFSLGFKALGLGVERVRGRMALRAKGLDPDDAAIHQSFKNTAAFEAALKELGDRAKDTSLVISEKYTLAPPIGEVGRWYYGARCACGQLEVDPGCETAGAVF